MKKTILILLLSLMFYPMLAMKPDTIPYRVTPNHYGLQYRQIDFYTSDNVRLVGWLIPAQEYQPYGKDEDGYLTPGFLKNPVVNEYDINKYMAKPTIIVSNGDAGNISYIVYLANEFSKSGFNTFLFDWRGFGESQSWEIDSRKLCISEFLIDYDAAIETVATLPEVDASKICAYGYSTGFYLAFAAAVQNPKLKCIGGRALITNFVDVMYSLSSLIDTSRIVIPEDYPEYLLPINCADKLKCPIYMMVGEFDPKCPVWMSEMVYAKINTRKKLNIIKGEEHCVLDLDLEYSLLKDICDFFKEGF